MAHSWKLGKGPDITLDLRHIEEFKNEPLHTTNDYVTLMKDDVEIISMPIWFDKAKKMWKDKCHE